ncbi:MAG: type II/IV secretion system ATPase subunit [Candidatus Caldarchaeum sp.]|uniref:Flagellar protein FlaI n=3 Tax=Caldiarchaeum subterraneum TaxID=311458 RepID=A0A7C4DZW9_CALS0|nr:type II/IV secretion system ATPase subunit [Candidatus Caldarchaeales archaeon]
MSNVPSRVLMENPHLRMYIEELRLQGKTATYVEQLSREMRNLRSYSFIYPVGDPLFIHVESRPSERSSYNVISPFTMAPVEINKIVEKGLARLITPEMDYTTREEHEKLLNELLDMFLEIDDTLEDFDYRPIYRKGIVEKLAANQTTADIIRNSVILDKVYLGTLEPFIRDQYIEDVSCNGVGPIFVEHKIFGSCETNITFSDQEELDTFVVKLSERIGRAVNFRKPIVDASLPDGSRINIVFGSDVSRHGSNFTIRKFSEKPVSIADLISWGTMSSLEAAYLWIMLEHGMSIWFCGETASGKTTALRAASVFINPSAKIVSIEDTPEIVVPHENWVREVTRQGEQGEGDITLFDLLKAALRQRPNYIIVGEIRGAEASVAFQAMQTGHPVLATFHAGSVEKLIQRLTGDPINIPKTYIDILNCVLIQSAVRLPSTGKVERRVLSINEIVGYDPTTQRFDYIELFNWDSSTDKHEFRGEGNSYLLENKIRTMLGVSPREVHRIYQELFDRAQILELLVRRKNTEFETVWRIVKEVYHIGTQNVLEKLESVQRI